MAHGVVDRRFTRVAFVCLMAICLIASAGRADTVVRFDTALGSFHVQLFDTVAPLTVQNFMAYVNYGYYANSFYHRLIDSFVLQGGGFGYNDGFYSVPKGPAVLNEFSVSNTRGTIAMAKLPGDPDSATNEFFFNLGDNSANLDGQNGGFTVFGEVIGNGMDVVDLLASQETFLKSYEFIGPPYPPFDELPLIGYDGVDPNWTPFLEMIYNITPAIGGDANGDGVVDLQDFGILKASFGGVGDWSAGDFTGDGNIDLQDFGILKANFGVGVASAVPEPASAAMLLACGLPMLTRRIRRRK